MPVICRVFFFWNQDLFRLGAIIIVQAERNEASRKELKSGPRRYWHFLLSMEIQLGVELTRSEHKLIKMFEQQQPLTNGRGLERKTGIR